MINLFAVRLSHSYRQKPSMISQILKLGWCLGTALILAGCTTTSQAPVRPASTKPEPSNALYSAETAFHSGKHLQSLNLLNTIIASDPNNAQALFLQGLIYLKTGDLEQSKKSFEAISADERTVLAESCIELSELETERNRVTIQTIAQLYFPDCLAELNSKTQRVDLNSLTEDEVIKYGRLLDQVMQGEDDPEIRRLKEEAFLQEHQLTNDQLDEITTKYLDYLADQN